MQNPDEMRKILLRHGPPNKFDYADYRAIMRVEGDDHYDIFIQCNKEEKGDPDWRYVGRYLKTDSIEISIFDAEARLPKRN